MPNVDATETWRKTELFKFFETANYNRNCGAANFPLAFQLLSDVNDSFVRVGENLIHSEQPLTGALFLRSCYAFKTAVGLALAGQAVEASQASRLCLEMAGYGLIMHDSPEKFETFVMKNADPVSKRKMKDAYQIAKVQAAINKKDARLGEIFRDLYERAIDFGGHPNPFALFSTMEMRNEGEMTAIKTLAMTDDPKVILHSLKLVTQCGVTALHIAQHIFPAKFMLLGIQDKLREFHTRRFEFGAGI